MIEKPKKERRFLKILGKVAEILVQELLIKVGKSLVQKIGGKKTLPSIIFLLLFYNIAFASIDSIPYPITGNKQRLGWQTTGNGLVYRGRSNDTITKPTNYVDKNVKAYLILDSVRGTIFVWRQTYWDSLLVGNGGGGSFTQPVDSLFFNTSVPTNNVDTAKMRWDSDLATVVLGMYDQVPNELGFKSFWLVKNQTGSTITKGSIVYANGTVGASGRITVAKFIANGTITAKYLLGVTAHDLTDGEDGYVISFGKIRQVNTDTFAAGAILYPSPTVAGVWTDVEPIAPNIDMPIGFCINSSSNNGTIAIRVASGYKLSELHDVAISSPVNNSSLYYKSSEGLWLDTTAALLVSDTASMLIPYLRKLDTITLSNRINTKLNISDTASMLLPYLRDADTVTLSNRINLKLNIADTSAFARDNQISGTSGQVAYFNSSSSVVSDTALRWSAANKSLGINMTTTPSGANLIIKNSQEPVRSTVVTTQTFAADTTNWTRGTGWTFNGTVAVATAATGDLTYTPALTITSGNGYEITYTVTGYTAGTLTARVGNGSLTLPTHNISSNVILIAPTDATGGFRFTTSTFTGNIDNVSIVQVANRAPILIAAQDDNTTAQYDLLASPNNTSISLIGGGRYSTGTNNVFVGEAAGISNTTGIANNFFGSQAGQNNTTGQSNNFFGNGAGFANTTGQTNNFFGNAAGASNTTGTSNNFFGNLAGEKNTTGGGNNFFGSSAGRNNTTGGSNNFFGNGAGLNNTTGLGNNFFGFQAGYNNTTGEQNNMFGFLAGYNNTTGIKNVFIGSAVDGNRTGSENVFIGNNAARNSRSGSANIAIGTSSLSNSVDTLSGSNNIAIGVSAIQNIRFGANQNVGIGYANFLPTPNGSNQGVYQNVLFFTGASGTGTTIAAASKAGIKTNAPNRDLEVAGEVRITDLTTDAPTRLVGADADGDLGQVTLGAGLSLASSSLLADTSFLVTRFDTAAMLTPYFRDADTTSLNLTSRFAAKLNLSDTLNMLVPYLRKADTTNMLLPYFRDADTTSLNLTSRFAAKLNLSDTASMLTNYLSTGVAASTYQTILTNPITGTGTTNYISKFTGTSTLGNSLINDNGNYIGINKSTPTVGIDLVNDLSSTSAKLRLQTNFDNAQRTLELGSGDGLSWDLPGQTSQSPFIKVIGGDQTFGGGGLNLMTNNTSRLFIRQNGTIGIGTITPNATFEVHGSSVFNEGSADADFRVESDGNENMVFVDASTDRVGIGYASPTKTLDVNGEVRINTLTATPTSLLGKDGSNVLGEVTTIAQTGLMKSGGTTANTSSVGIITVAHGLSYTPSQVIATISQQNSYVIVCHSKDATNLSFTVYDSVTGNPLNNVSVGFFWLAIK